MSRRYAPWLWLLLGLFCLRVLGQLLVEIELWPTSIVLFRGHRIRLEVSSSNFPRFDRNPNTGGGIADETRPVTARQTIRHGRDTPSHLILPVVSR